MKSIIIIFIFTMGAFAHAATDVVKDIEYDKVDGVSLTLDLYPAQNPKFHPARAVLLIHGGCYQWGSKEERASEARYLAGQGFSVFVVNYRKAPEYLYPAALTDVQMALRWIRQHSLVLHIDANRIAAVGDSSGATLAAKLGVQPSPDRNGKLDQYSDRVSMVVDFYGRTDFTLPVAKGAQDCPANYIGKDRTAGAALYREASVLPYVDSSSARFLIFHGLLDKQVEVDHSRKLERLLIDNKVPYAIYVYEIQGHGFNEAASKDAWSRAAEFLNLVYVIK